MEEALKALFLVFFSCTLFLLASAPIKQDSFLFVHSSFHNTPSLVFPQIVSVFCVLQLSTSFLFSVSYTRLGFLLRSTPTLFLQRLFISGYSGASLFSCISELSASTFFSAYKHELISCDVQLLLCSF